MHEIDDKTVLKWNTELVELHKRCITSYLSLKGVSFSKRKRFFKLYDKYVDEQNIRLYYNRPIHLFVFALVRDELTEISLVTKHKDQKYDRKGKIINIRGI